MLTIVPKNYSNIDLVLGCINRSQHVVDLVPVDNDHNLVELTSTGHVSIMFLGSNALSQDELQHIKNNINNHNALMVA